MKNNLTALKKIDWYREETGSSAYFAVPASYGCVASLKDRHVFWCCGKDETKAFLPQALLRRRAERYLEKERGRSGAFDAMFRAWEARVVKKNEVLFRQIDAVDLKKLSSTRLINLNKRLGERSFKMWTEFHMEIFDLDGEGLIERELVRAGKMLTNEERVILTASEEPLIYQKSEQGLLETALLVKKTPGAEKTFSGIFGAEQVHRLKLYPEIEGRISVHAKKYHWLQNSWASVTVLSPANFIELIKQMLAGGRNLRIEIKAIENYAKQMRGARQAIYKRHKFSPWLRRMFHVFRLLVYWRDVRKEQVQKLNFYLEECGRELARRAGAEWSDLRHLDPREIDSLAAILQKRLREERRKMENWRVLNWDGRRVRPLGAAEGRASMRAIEEAMNKEASEIRGQIACPGKVKGRVVVIGSEKDFNKMRDGFVLVTPMTRPEFVPLMKRAGGIITDEGGITSHAAIVSRELNIPCVIGTRVASKILKDGQDVFVNADHGLISII